AIYGAQPGAASCWASPLLAGFGDAATSEFSARSSCRVTGTEGGAVIPRRTRWPLTATTFTRMWPAIVISSLIRRVRTNMTPSLLAGSLDLSVSRRFNLVVSGRPGHFQAVADLMGSRNSQRGLLRDLFQEVAGDSTLENDDPSTNGDLYGTQS